MYLSLSLFYKFFLSPLCFSAIDVVKGVEVRSREVRLVGNEYCGVLWSQVEYCVGFLPVTKLRQQIYTVS